MDIDGERYTEAGEFPRWQMYSPIQIYVREDLPHLAGHTRDISLRGIHIEIGLKLPLKSIIILEIYFQRGNVFEFIEQEPLKIKGQIMWRKTATEEGHEIWSMGVAFVDITPEHEARISEEVEVLDSI